MLDLCDQFIQQGYPILPVSRNSPCCTAVRAVRRWRLAKGGGEGRGRWPAAEAAGGVAGNQVLGLVAVLPWAMALVAWVLNPPLLNPKP
mgnify:CR=1 FL=1